MTFIKISTSKILQNSSLVGIRIRTIIVNIVVMPQIYTISRRCSSCSDRVVMKIAITNNVKIANSKNTISFAGSLFI